MQRPAKRVAVIVILAAVFTVGMAFATVELPYLIDGYLQKHLTTPGLDSHADEISRLKTDLFIAHFHLRVIGYVAFTALLALIVAGFARGRASLATLGAVGIMLTVFAQFAAVMFFLAGLGVLNVLWLPVLDLSINIPRLGVVIRAPYDGARWLLGALGVENTYWPVVLFVIGGGLLVFFLGTLAWLAARTRKEPVAAHWVYRLSRHPQYLGWIIWSYGVYLLLLQGRYPRRSWGIDASLPWLVSTMVILGVAFLEELDMRGRHGEVYEGYRRRAPFLFPVPSVVERLFALPLRVLFRKERFERRREVATVVGLYTLLLVGASTFFYGPARERFLVALSPSREMGTVLAELADEIRDEPENRPRYFLAQHLAGFGEDAVPWLVTLLREDDPGVRAAVAEQLAQTPEPDAVPALVEALGDPDANVRGWSVRALWALGEPSAVDGLRWIVLGDEQPWPRNDAIAALAALGAQEAVDAAVELLDDPQWWMRLDGVEALGLSGSARAVPVLGKALADESVMVRRTAVVALLQIGSPEGRPLLQEALQDEDWEVRLYASEALKRMR
jgi:protein-S-isoprenylcysteine O-methyltransferase Ste14